MSKRLFIETVGCQMNILDSEMVVASLRRRGYQLTTDPKSADAILYNTCSVREHAEEKVYSSLGKLKKLKARHPEKIIGVIGCMAKNHQQQVFDRAPYVDIVVGPGQLHQIPQLLENVAEGEGRQVEVSLGRKDGSIDQIKNVATKPLIRCGIRRYDLTEYQAYIRIQIGCDKFCTYCIVPMVRGPEQGRPPEQIIEEAKIVAEQGCLEVVLLGQTVNSYRYSDGDQTTRLSDLLTQLHEIEGLKRLKFVTSYPKDMTPDLLETVATLPKCSPYLHVPAQSGSNTVLQRMKRGYTVEDYRDMMARIRETVPGYAVSSDFIVGFSGETDEDFQQTVDLLEECRFKNSFIFKYSVRPGTKGSEQLPDDIPDEVKRDRNQQLLKIQNRISQEDNERFLGEKMEVLVEGPSKLGRNAPEDQMVVQMVGRTHCDRIVVFDGNRRQAGQLLPIGIHDASSHTLFGSVVTEHQATSAVYSLG